MSVTKNRFHVAVAMSGGVDSAVAAAMLVEQGHRVVGIHMKLHDIPDAEKREKSCCSLDDSLDARQACAKLGIPFYTVNFVDEFKHNVMDYFVSGYQQGLTPNPCVMCNRSIKTNLLMQKVREIGCTHLATGHYAQINFCADTERFQLARPMDIEKDQTYFLFHTQPAELPFLLFPLANLQKQEARQLAHTYGFNSWDKPDSQQICFVPKDYRHFLSEQLEPEAIKAGEIVDVSGRVLAKHGGMAFFTIGQRKGLGISHQKPLYVVGLIPSQNRVVVGEEEDLQRTWLEADDVNWVSCFPPEKPISVSVKVRYAHKAQSALLTPLSEHRVRVDFEMPVRGIAPGQAAVFYDEQILLGGGWITQSGPLPYSHSELSLSPTADVSDIPYFRA